MTDPEDFDRDMFGFVVAFIGMAACLLGAGIWSLIA